MTMLPVIPSATSPVDPAATSASGLAVAETEAQLYIEIFNNFLLDGPTTTSALSAPGASTDSLLIQLLNSQATSKAGNSKSLSDSLAAIGIGFQQPTALNTAGQLTLDTAKLQAAYTADPSGTQAAVSQAVQSIGQLSAKFSSLFMPDFSTGSSTASLFGGQSTSDGLLGAFGSGSDSSSIWDTLALNPQLAAAQILGAFNTGSATPSTAADFLSTFNTGSATPSIFDIFAQNPQLEAEQILGTLPPLPPLPTAPKA